MISFGGWTAGSKNAKPEKSTFSGDEVQLRLREARSSNEGE